MWMVPLVCGGLFFDDVGMLKVRLCLCQGSFRVANRTGLFLACNATIVLAFINLNKHFWDQHYLSNGGVVIEAHLAGNLTFLSQI